MKKLKLIPGLILLALCVAVLGIGIYAASPASNQITGTVTVNAAKAPITISAYKGTSSTGTLLTGPHTTRTGVTLQLGNLTFVKTNGDSLSLANSLSEVADILITFTISTTSSEALGVYFSTDGTITNELKDINNGESKIATSVTYNESATLLITSTLSKYKQLTSSSAIEMTMILHLERLVEETISNLSISNVYLYVEPYNSDLAIPNASDYTGVLSFSYTNSGYARTATVGKASIGSVSGDFVMPEQVRYNGMVFTVTALNMNAFSGCNGITSLTLPSTITSINESALSINASYTLTIYATAVPTASNAPGLFGNVTAIYVPAESVSAYRTAWASKVSNANTIIQAIS